KPSRACAIRPPGAKVSATAARRCAAPEEGLTAPDTAGTSGTDPRLPCESIPAPHRLLATPGRARCTRRRDPFPVRACRGSSGRGAAGDGGGARTNAAGHSGGVLGEGNGFLVDRDSRLADRGLGDLAGEPLREYVDQHQMIVGAAADQTESGAREPACQPLRI